MGKQRSQPSHGPGKRKAPLPSKACAYCGKPFSWRKKWARAWPNVKYCSERCRRQARRG